MPMSQMRLECNGEVYDTTQAELLAEDLEDEHPRRCIYQTKKRSWFMTESTSELSAHWRYHNRITIVNEKEAYELMKEMDPESVQQQEPEEPEFEEPEFDPDDIEPDPEA